MTARHYLLPIIVLLLACLPASAGFARVAAAPATNAVVGTGTPASCTEAKFDAALAAIGTGGGTITFNCGGAATITFSDQKIIPGNITIDGAGQITLSGGKKTRLFFVNSGLFFTLKGLVLRDGSASVGGGLLEIFGGDVDIHDSELRDSTAVTEGGAINCSIDQVGSIELSDSTLAGNQAKTGGAIYSGGCQLILDNTTFSANKADAGSGSGGAIYLGGTGELQAHSLTLDQNEAYEGGGLYVDKDATAEIVDSRISGSKASMGAGISSQGTVEISGSLLQNNKAIAGGGGIRSFNATLQVSNSTLSGNYGGGGGGALVSFGRAEFYDTTFEGNGAGQQGAGIDFDDGTLNVVRCTFSGNATKDTDGWGGAIQQGSGTMQLLDSTLAGNQAGSGGGLYYGGGSGLVIYSTFSANEATDGSQIYNFGGSSLKLLATAIDGYSATCAGKPVGSYGYNLASGPCGGLDQPGDQVNLRPLKLGPLQDNGGANQMLTILPAIDSPLVDAIPPNACPQAPTEDQRLFPRGGGASCDVGAVERQGSDLKPVDAVVGDGTPQSCTEAAFESALATAQALGNQTVTFNCGAVMTILLTSPKTITAAVTIDGGNQITLSGGDKTPHFLVAASSSPDSDRADAGAATAGDLTLENIVLSNGFSYVDGGSIENLGSLTLRHVVIQNSKTEPTYAGGAIANYGALTIENSQFDYNAAGNGGALYLVNADGSATITDTLFRGNTASAEVSTGWGGAIVLWDGALLAAKNTRFDSNTALAGGAIYGDTDDTTIALSEGTAIVANTAKNGYSGGLYSTGHLDLSEVTVSNNSGGGVYSLGDLKAYGSTFSGNIAEGGAGLDNRGKAVIENSTFSGNHGGLGAGMINSGTASLFFVTFSDNEGASGASLYHDGDSAQKTLTLQNVILNQPPGGQNCGVEAGSVTQISSLGHNLSSDASCGLTQVSDMEDTDPLLGPLAENGGKTLTHLPAKESPAADHGLCLVGTTADQRGAPRPFGDACDIGAVEVGMIYGGSFSYIPVVRR
ncbi:MAG: choice-of-anchor Q domain-containing protein [Candidatus Promineifilaceae bacterium]